MSIWDVTKPSQVNPGICPGCGHRNPPGYRTIECGSCGERFSPYGLVSEGKGYVGDSWSGGTRMVVLALVLLAGVWLFV